MPAPAAHCRILGCAGGRCRLLVLAFAGAYVGSTQGAAGDAESEPLIREPIFNVPLVVVATVGVWFWFYAVRMFVLTDDQDVNFLLDFRIHPGAL